MIKGGYKIVNFNGAALSGTAETLTGIYDQIVDDYDKPIMVSGVSLNGDIMDDAYASVQEKISGDLSKSVELTVYGGIITVTEDDEVTFAVSKTTEELNEDIGDIEDILKNFGYPLSSEIKNNVDLNTVTNPGFYSLGSGLTNAPVQYIILIVAGSATAQIAQFAINTGKFYSRERRSNTWTSWKILEFGTIV